MAGAITASMRALLRPESVAIVGATPGTGRGGWIHDQLLRHGYAGPIYPVNPKYEQIRGAKAYPSLLAIHEPVEFVAVALGANKADRAAVPKRRADPRRDGSGGRAHEWL